MLGGPGVNKTTKAARRILRTNYNRQSKTALLMDGLSFWSVVPAGHSFTLGGYDLLAVFDQVQQGVQVDLAGDRRGHAEGRLFVEVNKGGRIGTGKLSGEALRKMLEKRSQEAQLSKPITWHDFCRTGLSEFMARLREAGWADKNDIALKNFKISQEGHTENGEYYLEWTAKLGD